MMLSWSPTKRKINLFLVLAFGLVFGQLVAQPIITMGSNPFVTTCDATFVDDGGVGGDHSNGGPQTITICSNSANPSMTHVRLTFGFLEIAGTIEVYNADFADPGAQINTLDAGNNTPFGLVIEASASNPSGCLTLVFTPSGTSSGWSANVSCIRACQPVRAALASTDPEIMPVDTGYIDICRGDRVFFNGTGIYPEDGVIYDQDDATSTFSWNFDDGGTATGPNVSHVFDEPGGYIVQLSITDVNGCTNSNQISQRVRVAGRPNFNLQAPIPDIVCANDTIVLAGSTEIFPNPDSEVFVTSAEQTFSAGQVLSDTTFLPDGSGVEYTTSLEFGNFTPGATVTNVNDIIGICLNMEHSYAGDLDIWLECPNGNELFMVRFGGLGGQYVGEPVDQDNLIQGVGYDYCWTPDATTTWDDAGVGGAQSIPAGDYAAEDPFTNLLGCPLNGEWTIHVRDNLSIDNGYIFNWGITFQDYLFPNLETFRVGIDSSFWEQTPNLAFYSEDSIRSIPPFAGTSAYVYTVIDSFGCESDTTLLVDVLPFSAPECYDCQPILDSMAQSFTVCNGSMVQTSLATETSIDTSIAWADFPLAEFGVTNAPNQANAFRSTIGVNSIRPIILTDAINQIESVCVEIETPFTDEVSFFLEAPNGALLELSTNNGITMDYSGTCFTPNAATPITAGTNPFTGEFQPEGNWTTLNGTNLNGDWTLVAWDIAGPTTPGRFVSWSITFVHENNLTYSWSPMDGTLSCTDCPNPIITAASDQVYTVTVEDDYGCMETGTVTLNTGQLDATVTSVENDPSCAGLQDGSIDITITGGVGLTYAWSNMAITEDIAGVGAGTYTVTISDGGCQTERSFTLEEPTAVEASLVSVDSVSCFGAGDGSIDISSAGGTGVFTYAWDDPNLQVLEDAVFLTAGTYTLIVADENDCRDTIMATVEEPQELSLAFTSDPVACQGQSTGSVVATPGGGNSGYTYSWETGDQTAAVNDLAAGTYALTVTDSKGCQIVDSVSVNEPTSVMMLAAVQDQMGCADAALNIATVNPMGGQAPYTYEWPNGALTQTASNLSAGLTTVLVTDDVGCTDSIQIDLVDLEPITFNLITTSPSCDGFTDGAMGLNQLTGGAATDPMQYTYQWSSGSQDIVAMNLTGGTTYSLTVTDQQGCTGIAERFLDNPAPILFTADSSAVSCFGFTDGELNITSITGPNPGNYAIQWDANAGSSTDSLVSNLGAGVYTVLITDALGCTSSRQLSITQPDQLTADFAQVDVTCAGDFDGQIQTTLNGGTPGFTYAWSNGADTPNISGLVPGNYNLVVTDGNGCTITETVEIIGPDPVIATASSEDVICFGDATGRITINGTGGRAPYTYSVDNSGFSRGEEFIGLTSGTYTAFVRDASGCVSTTQITVEEGPQIALDLGEDLTIVFGDSLDLMANINGAVGAVNYFWRGSYDGTLTCPGDTTGRADNTVVFCATPNAKPEYEIDYSLLVIDENGCEVEDRIRVRVPKIRVADVPTGFTPNNDGQNDLLVVHGRPGTRIGSFEIYDRWGELIYEDRDYEVNDLNRGWNGFYKDEPVNAGTYLWKLRVIYEDESEEVLSGETTLLR